MAILETKVLPQSRPLPHCPPVRLPDTLQLKLAKASTRVTDLQNVYSGVGGLRAALGFKKCSEIHRADC